MLREFPDWNHWYTDFFMFPLPGRRSANKFVQFLSHLKNLRVKWFQINAHINLNEVIILLTALGGYFFSKYMLYTYRVEYNIADLFR